MTNSARRLKLFLFAFLSILVLLVSIEKSYSVSASFAKRDDVITAQLQAKIAADPILSHFSVSVNTVSAVVSIQAVVDTAAQANKLVILANTVAGVKSVDASGIVVKKPKPSAAQIGKPKPKNTQTFSADSVITSQVIGLYIREGMIDANHPETATIHVKTQQGVVYLSGTVANDALATNAVNLAQTINGVVKVVSSLTTSQ